MGQDVFISYKSEEFQEADWVRQQLESGGISCWMAPNSITGGASFSRIRLIRAVPKNALSVITTPPRGHAAPTIHEEICLPHHGGTSLYISSGNCQYEKAQDFEEE